MTDVPSRPARILVIEDDDAVRALTAVLLREDGYDVIEADDGLEALHQLTAGPPPDLILLDLWMPSMTGWEFRVEQKRDPVLGAVPVIVTSADDRPEATAIDAAHFLRKPYSPEELRALVGRLLTPLGQAGEGRRYAEADVIAGKYSLTRLLAEGGMGAIWLAKNLALDADVAVKLIRHEAAGTRAGERLLFEARAIARLDHPCVVRVFDFGETEQRDPFIVMELLKGGSLADLLDQRRLAPEEAVQLMLPVVSALDAAHAKGIVHRDLKPENLVLVADERGVVTPKVVDFGIAKLQRDEEDDRHATRTGAVVGSPGYMSPEQARGKTDVDERSDVWALSVVLYEAISGQRPFDGHNYNVILAAILEETQLPLTSFGTDADLSSIVERGLAKEPADRWPSMRDLGRALADWATLRGIETDVTGGSIALHWQREATPVPLVKGVLVPEVVGRPTAPTAPPTTVPPRGGRGRKRTLPWFALAAAMAAVVIVGRAPLARVVAQASMAPAAAPAQVPLAPAAAPPAPPPERDPVAAEIPATATTLVDVNACVARLFPDDTFADRPPSVATICGETDPRRGAALLRTEVVRGGDRAVTEGMREWAVLGWYEMAAFALVRGRCCPGAARETLPPSVGTCEPLDDSLNDLARTVARSDAERALARYTAAVHCAVTSGASGYTYGGHPAGGAEGALRKLLGRTLPTGPTSDLE